MTTASPRRFVGALAALLLASCADGPASQSGLEPVPDTLPSTAMLTAKTAACFDVTYLMKARGEPLRGAWRGATGAYRAQLETLMGCIREASTCEAVRGCYGWELDPACQPGCSGDTMVTCAEVDGETWAIREDCSARFDGMTTCQDVGYPICTSLGVCDIDQTADSCDGDVLVACPDDRRVDCAALGGQCRIAGAKGRCVVDDDVCQDKKPVCVGDKLVSCDVDDLPYVVDCSESLFGPNTSCRDVYGESGARSSMCIPSDPLSGPDCADRCEGDVAVACVGTVEARVDCSLMPGATCGMTFQDHASCVMAQP